MQEICSEAGISPGALYRYFSSKADIIAAIAVDERRERDTALADVRGSAGLIEALCGIAEAVMGRFQTEAYAPIFADVFAEAARDPVLARKLAEIDAQSVDRLAGALTAAQARGEIDANLDPGAAARTLIATIEGFAMRHAFGKPSDAASDGVANFRALVERYLAVHP